MATKREFFCDLCRKPIREVPEETIRRPGIGVIVKPDGSIIPTPTAATEKHICMLCIQAIKGLSVS